MDLDQEVDSKNLDDNEFVEEMASIDVDEPDKGDHEQGEKANITGKSDIESSRITEDATIYASDFETDYSKKVDDPEIVEGDVVESHVEELEKDDIEQVDADAADITGKSDNVRSSQAEDTTVHYSEYSWEQSDTEDPNGGAATGVNEDPSCYVEGVQMDSDEMLYEGDYETEFNESALEAFKDCQHVELDAESPFDALAEHSAAVIPAIRRSQQLEHENLQIQVQEGTAAEKSDNVSVSRSVKAPSSADSRKQASSKRQLESIELQIKEVRRKIQELGPASAAVTGLSPGKGFEPQYTERPKKLGGLHHPQVEYVVEKLIHSPYLTGPQNRYPQATFRVNEAIDTLLHSGISYKSIPKDQAPFDYKRSKRVFLKEIVHFKPRYGSSKKNHSRSGVVSL
jgi:hypothetical protein